MDSAKTVIIRLYIKAQHVVEFSQMSTNDSYAYEYNTASES